MSDQRFEAAKAALQGMRSNPEYAENSSEEIAMFAQVDADSLLARLKETEPKPVRSACSTGLCKHCAACQRVKP